MDLFDILKAAMEAGASDIHLAVGSPPSVRVQGEIFELPAFPILGPEACKNIVYSFLYDRQRSAFEQRMELDCSFEIAGLARYRANVLVQKNGIEAVLRVIPARIQTPEELGLSATMMGLADLSKGLVLITGAAGAGKSTTLSCLIEQINLKYRKHIVTIEDPIEFVYQKKNSLIRQRELGAHTFSFQEALTHALRQDPDVIVVGEMRDLESIALALTAAETGHLCFATLHTGNAVQTIDRIIDVFPPHHQQQIRVQLADCLQAVICQALISDKERKGRVAARELMVNSPAVANLIREGKTHMVANLIQTGGKSGMVSMQRSLEDLVRNGRISLSEVMSAMGHTEKILAGITRGLANGVLS